MGKLIDARDRFRPKPAGISYFRRCLHAIFPDEFDENGNQIKPIEVLMPGVVRGIPVEIKFDYADTDHEK